MQPPVPYSLHQQHLWLSAERCIFWEEEKALILADLHFGKTGHFRKHGIPVPQAVYKQDLQRLIQQMQYFQPKQLIVVGDLFHSRENKELELFRKWRQDLPDIDIKLIPGNHDILHNQWYQQSKITVTQNILALNNLFGFVHDPEETDTTHYSDHYFFTGHLHPGIRISGQGRQSLSFPCYYFTATHCILPAFSEFTGLAMVRPAAGEKVFAIVGKKVMQFH